MSEDYSSYDSFNYGKCILYKCTKPNLRGRKKLVNRFNSLSKLMEWVDKNIKESEQINYFVR